MVRHCWRKARSLPRKPIRRGDRRADKPSGCGALIGKCGIPAPEAFAELGVFWVGVGRGNDWRSEAPAICGEMALASGLRPIGGRSVDVAMSLCGYGSACDERGGVNNAVLRTVWRIPATQMDPKFGEIGLHWAGLL